MPVFALVKFLIRIIYNKPSSRAGRCGSLRGDCDENIVTIWAIYQKDYLFLQKNVTDMISENLFKAVEIGNGAEVEKALTEEKTMRNK